MKLYNVKGIVVGRILKMPENSDVFMRTLIIKNASGNCAITLYSEDKGKLELDDRK